MVGLYLAEGVAKTLDLVLLDAGGIPFFMKGLDPLDALMEDACQLVFFFQYKQTLKTAGKTRQNDLQVVVRHTSRNMASRPKGAVPLESKQNTRGTGRPCSRAKAMVATSLSTTKYGSLGMPMRKRA